MTNNFPAIKNQYKESVLESILLRFRICAPLGIILHLFYYLIDRLSHPEYDQLFLEIRVFACSVILLFFLFSFHSKLKRLVLWFADISSTVIICGLATMSFLTDGSSSRYYEGVSLVFLGMGFINPYNFRNNFYLFLGQIILFETIMLANKTPFNFINFSYANYFMGCTAFFVVLMTKFYSTQHYNAFVRQEQLKVSEAKLAALFNQADKLSKTDELTKIHNRRFFFEMLENKIKSCESTGHTFYLIIFDIDHFKQINDTYGHTFGDEALKYLAEAVKKSIRANDFFGRYGGDEFILCLEQISKDNLYKRLTIVSNNIKLLNLTHQGQHVPISASFGAAPFVPNKNMTSEQLMELADAQLLEIKKNARGSIGILE